MPSFKSFVMFAEMRTGSNYLEANLNALDGVVCHGEAFNPHFIGKKDQTEYLGVTLAERERDPGRLLAAMRGAGGMSGFRYFHDHDPRIFDLVMNDPTCAKVVLTRNPLDSYVSLKIAQATGQWKLTNAKAAKSARIRFDGPEFHAHLDQVQGFQRRLIHALQSRGQTAFYLAYEDIPDLDVLNGLAAFLGVPARLEALDDRLKKQNPEQISEKVENPDDMAQALASLDRFDLTRTPNFEPRRAPGVPGFVAAKGAGLLFMPLRGGPVAQVQGWLSVVGQGGLETGFVQKNLRQWKRAQIGHRSFTVVTHPVVRAYRAFVDLAAQPGDQRGVLGRVYGVDLPRPGQGFADLGARRAAFIAFLRFLRRALGGQTGLRVDGVWATQAALIQGFSQFQAPDLTFREERLAEGLAFVCGELGLAMPPYTPAAADPDLADLYGPDIEEAARDAYGRDYMAFGYGDFAPGDYAA